MCHNNHYFFLKNTPILHSVTIIKFPVTFAASMLLTSAHMCTPSNSHLYPDFLDIDAMSQPLPAVPYYWAYEFRFFIQLD